MANCTICSKPEATFSLPLKKEAKKWQTAPICKECRWALIKRARGEGKFIRIYDLEASIKEAERRNLEDDRLNPILKAYAVTSRKDEAVNRYLKLANSQG